MAGLTIGASAVAYTAASDAPVSFSGDTYTIRTGGETVAITPLNNDLFRITTIPAGARDFRLPESQSAILKPQAMEVSSFITPEDFSLVSPTTVIRVNRKTGKVTFMNASGDTLLTEAEGVSNSGNFKRISHLTSGKENFYGAGERGHSLRLNGDTLVMFNRQNYGYTAGDPRISQMGITVPYFASDKGYGVLYDDYNEASLSLGDTIVYISETPKPLSYYFINGEGSLGGVTSNYTLLTGRQNLPPFWALGYITSKYGYHNEQEALGAVDSLKRAGYPVDGIVFDLYWYGVETDMGRLEWDKKQFPDHRRMLDSLNVMGVNTILISQPYINKIGAIDNYNTLDKARMLTRDASGKSHDVTTWVGDAGMFDISNPDTREWLWNRLRPLTAEGLAGWWGDLGEPEVHPLTIRHANGETASQYHNVYGNEWSRLIYEGLRKDFPDMRPILLMRGGTAGLQRYSVFPWTTDVSRSWGGLQPQINLMLNSGLSGLGYMSSDIGGFAVDPAHPYDPELYVRWLEMGTFTPVLRTHAQFKPEPYHYPAQQEILRKFIKMRYEWLPYNYTLAYENAAYGLPLARPLNFHSKDQSGKYDDVQDEYLWGAEVLVAPVMKAGARSRKVLFPEGEWIDWNKPSLKYKGGATATVQAPLGTMPLFVKAGSFIPQYLKEINNVTEYDPSVLTIKYFPAAEASSYTLFEDDRKDPESLTKGNYCLMTFSAAPNGNQLDIHVSAEGSYEGMPASRNLTFEIPGIKRPRNVAGGKWSYNASTSTLRIEAEFSDSPLTLSII
ncbi:MAG: DUF5110 domain-containing protein [Muribaculaceae bacterium]|nr:DUF5110 domain-containing protein [Muribaculaceae bacterium]